MPGKSQPLYRIRATRRCRTHPPGTEIDYTGPRNAVTRGWKIIGRYKGAVHHLTGDVVWY